MIIYLLCRLTNIRRESGRDVLGHVDLKVGRVQPDGDVGVGRVDDPLVGADVAVGVLAGDALHGHEAGAVLGAGYGGFSGEG